jgi:hypothetical protein
MSGSEWVETRNTEKKQIKISVIVQVNKIAIGQK